MRIWCWRHKRQESSRCIVEIPQDECELARTVAGQITVWANSLTGTITLDDSKYNSPQEIETTSTRLLRRVGQNDGEAWQRFVSLYAPVVRFWIRRAGVSSGDLPDVFSETFMAVLKNIGAFERQEGKAKFRAWLKTVTVNKVTDHFRRQGKQPMAYGGTTAMMAIGSVEDQATPDGDDDNDESLAESEEAFVVQRTLQLVRKEFREKTWLAFQRTAIDGQNATEVAVELGMTSLAVRKAKSRVMQRLKEALGEVAN